MSNRFLDQAEELKTSPEIMNAILKLAGGDHMLAELIQEDPTQGEINDVWNIVTNEGSLPSHQFMWSGHSMWAGDVDAGVK